MFGDVGKGYQVCFVDLCQYEFVQWLCGQCLCGLEVDVVVEVGCYVCVLCFVLGWYYYYCGQEQGQVQQYLVGWCLVGVQCLVQQVQYDDDVGE